MKYTCCCICLLVLSYSYCYGQQIISSSADTSTRYYWLCKLPMTVLSADTSSRFENKLLAARKLLFAATGEISYQHFNRSASSDDLLLINSSSDIGMLKLNLVYKEMYPFALSFRYNRASPFQLDDQFELNIGFDERNFRQLLMEKATTLIRDEYKAKYDQLLRRYQQAAGLYEQRKKTAVNPAYVQRVVEERLRKQTPVQGLSLDRSELSDITSRIPATLNNSPLADVPGVGKAKHIADSLSSKLDSIKNNIAGRVNTKKDSLQELLHKMEDSLVQIKNGLAKKVDSVRNKIGAMADTEQLKKYAGENGLEDSVKKNKWLDLLTKTNIRIGKFLLSNSELTVTNIFLHGASIKYGNDKFIMLSGGLYDFAFRQVFNIRNDTLPRNKPSVFAVKLGKTDGKNLSAVTFYTGKKTKRGVTGNQLEAVSGLAIEKKIYFNRNLFVEVEVAKSTTLRNSVAQESKGTIKDLFGSFSTSTIGIHSLVKAYLPKTKTDAELGYRYWGQQFQSFNASQYFNPQNSLSGKFSQPFFGRKLYIAGGAKYTDFRSFGIASNIHTKTVFASASATVRIKKLPIVSVGYYPGSQLYWMDQNKLYEYFYYIFNATASHYFNIGKLPMQTVFTYNKFFNKYTDSLVSGSQSYYNLFWTVWKNKFSYMANFSRQETVSNLLHTLEAGLTYSGRRVKIGGSIKWNQAERSTGIGYSLNGGLSLGKIGTINCIYDRSFLPDRNGAFIPVRMGQIQIIKPLKFSIWQ